ncbi:MAG: flagellar hook basal-body protein [Candidatus Eisenbacteria bacterium]|uniref:Flagellar hook basal-body protein n=1 Tax=Eiseniibacteriota bacterium TaxID=2212470 RepID=A0A849SPK1_UNCEI|nr:flagellar hook basal-body protein [Candidatus Eisenbacteria bacterium]
MPLNGIVNTARSLGFYLRLQEVTANNLANANTDSFKSDHLSAERRPGERFPVPVRTLDLHQGAFRETGRPLDVSLDGPGFFVVGTPNGERLTRGGSMRLDTLGRLTDVHGDPLLGIEGPIVIQGSKVELEVDGTVWVDGVGVGQLRRETVAEPQRLLKEAAGRFVPVGERGIADSEVTRVRQGAVEEPNVDPMLSMVDLIAIQRAYQANVDALRTLDSVLGTVTNEVGRLPN